MRRSRPPDERALGTRPDDVERGVGVPTMPRPAPPAQSPPPLVERLLTVWAPHTTVGVAWTPTRAYSTVLPAFRDLRALNAQLRALRARDRVFRLGIVAHGVRPGVIGMGTALSAEGLRSNQYVRRLVAELGDFVVPNGEITFFSCSGAAGAQGTELLRALSAMWPARTVTGFVTHGYCGGGGGGARNAAGNVTDTLIGLTTGSAPGTFPRQTPTGASAKAARDGAIVRWPRPDTLWGLYERHRPTMAQGTREALARAQRRRQLPAHYQPWRYYSTRVVDLDFLENPHVLRLSERDERAARPPARSDAPSAGSGR